MKNLFKLSIFAAFTMVFAACVNEEMAPVALQMKTITVTLDEVATRTTLNAAHTGLNWVAGDKFGYFTDGTGAEDNTSVEYTDGAVTYTLQVPVDATEINAYYPYYYKNTAAAVTLGMDAEQKQTAGGVFSGKNYPMAATATIDENNSVVLKFAPVASVLAFNVYNTAEHEPTEKVRSISLNAANSQGYASYDFEEGFTETLLNSDIIVTLDEPSLVGNAKPADTKIGESQIYLTLHKRAYTDVTVVVTTTMNTYTFTFAQFDCTSDISVVNLNLSRGTTPSRLSGDYVIVAKDNAGLYHALSSDVTGSDGVRLGYVTLEGFDSAAASYMSDDSKIKWTIAASGYKYTVKNLKNSYYLSYTSGNSACTNETEYPLIITKSADVSGTYWITLNDGTDDRWLARNTTSGFAFYKSGTGVKNLYLVPVVADTRETLATPVVGAAVVEGTPNSVTVSWNKVDNATEYIVTYIYDGDEVSETVVADATIGKYSYTFSELRYSADYTFTVVAKDNTATYRASAAGEKIIQTGVNPSGKTEYEVTWTSPGTIKDQTGTIKTGDFEWGFERDAVQHSGNSKGYSQFGKGAKDGVNYYEKVTFSTTNIPGTIKSVAVDCASASAKHTITITVGSVEYCNVATPKWSNNTGEVITGTGTSSGEIVILLTPGTGAVYVKSITIVYEN